MGVLSKVQDSLTSRNAAIIALTGTAAYFAYGKLNQKKIAPIKVMVKQDANKKERAAVDMVFFRRMAKIIRILIPNFFCTETGYIILVAISLMSRTYTDVWMIQNGTSIESAIISRNNSLFLKYLLQFIYAMPVISVLNSLLKYGLNQLKISFRTRLTNHLYAKYLDGFTYYKINNLDSRINNPDQLLSQDVDKFCDSVAELYSNLTKPVLDIMIYAMKLTFAIGAQGPGLMLVYLAISGLILTRLRRPLGKMTILEQQLEGEFRYVNSRLITNSEEIAFYQGNKKEKEIVLSSFKKLVNHIKGVIQFRFTMGFLDNIIAKYIATVVGYFVVSRPFLSDSSYIRNASYSDRLEEYYKSGRMLVKMAEAIGRVVLAGREMTRLSGFAARMTQFMEVLDDLNKGKYVRTMVKTEQRESDFDSIESKPITNFANLKPGSGKIIIQDHVIKFNRVPLVTPNGDVLVNELNFEVSSGKNVLVCGPNGCGKSSLFRILGDLWPLFGGSVTKPSGKNLFYVPQRPYMTLGSLRDQIIYPDDRVDQIRKGISDKELANILDKVHLSYILERDSWECVQDWMDVLSGGEKQRIAMARLFYHKPQFAILDECTSAVSVDVEGFMYDHCKKVGITLFTVSHRKSLWKYHEYYLHMDGRGSFEFKPIDIDTVEFGS